MSTLLRKDVPAACKWDPSHIYATQEDWEKDFEWIKEQTGKLTAMAGTLSQGREQVLAALNLYAEVGEHISRLYTYAGTNLNSDNGDAFYQGLGARAMSLYSQFAAAAAGTCYNYQRFSNSDVRISTVAFVGNNRVDVGWVAFCEGMKIGLDFIIF